MKVFELVNNSLKVKINSLGAELISVIKNNQEYIWQADAAVWARHAPVLFPIVGKLKNNQVAFNNETIILSQHGFARDNEFICIDYTNDTIVFELTANEKLLKFFPFHFSLQITYTLIGETLKTSYSIFNPDNKDLYFSIGAHPAFNCCFSKDDTFEDMELIFPSKNELVINTLNDGLITKHTKQITLIDHKLSISKELFDNDALVMMNSQISEVNLISKKSKQGVKMICKNWPYFGIWTKKHAVLSLSKQSNRFVCLEPWFGIADMEDFEGSLEQKEGIIKVLPENYFNCEFDITFI